MDIIIVVYMLLCLCIIQIPHVDNSIAHMYFPHFEKNILSIKQVIIMFVLRT